MANDFDILTEILNFIKNNMNVIWTLLSTLLGAFVSYKATTASEEKKEKRAHQREKLNNILIPLCSSVEEVIKVIEDYKIVDLKDLDTKIQDPFNYLKAEKRVFLSKNQRDMLENYKNMVLFFCQEWENEQKFVEVEYMKWLENQMRNCDDAPLFVMDVNISFSFGSNELIKELILTKKHRSLKNKVTSIHYVINDEPENFHSLKVDITEKLEELCGEIKYGCRSIDEIEGTEMHEIYNIYWFFMDLDDKTVVEKIISETKTNDYLNNLTNQLEKLHDCLLKNIDEITG